MRPDTGTFPVDGSTTVIASCGNCEGRTVIKIRHYEFGGAIRVKTDVHVARNLYLTPSVGFLGTHARHAIPDRYAFCLRFSICWSILGQRNVVDTAPRR